jgi:hypothetical protein
MNILFSLMLTLQEVSNPELIDKQVEMRGFLHESPEGELVLSTQPDVRSCCEGEKHPRVVVKGDINKPSKAKAVTVQGKLTKNNDHYEIRNATLR